MDVKVIGELHMGDYVEKTDIATYENADRYAVMTGDYDPIHFDMSSAQRSRY